MITIWKQDNKLIQIEQSEPNCWVNVVNPTPEEISRLISEFKINDAFINDVLDIDERSRLDIDDQIAMIILRVPHIQSGYVLPYITCPLGIVITDNSVLTISLLENEVLSELLHPLHLRNIAIDQKVNFVLQIVLRASIQFLKYLNEINSQTIEMDRDLKRSTQNKEIYKMLRIEKCLVYFITSLKSNELLLAKIEHSKYFIQNERDEYLLEDAIIETRQASEMAKIYSDILSGMMDTFGSIINNNLNTVMKTLTSVTILLMLPTLVSSFYGMNINLPFAKHQKAFYIILGISIALSVTGWFFLFFAEKFRFRNFRRFAKNPFALRQ